MNTEVDETFPDHMYWFTLAGNIGSVTLFVPKDMDEDNLCSFVKALHSQFENIENELRKLHKGDSV